MTRMDLAAVSDILEIQALLARYVFAIDAKDLDELDEVFTPDAEVDYSSTGGGKGPYSKIKPWLAKGLAPFPVSQHLIGLPAVKLDGDRATSKVMLFNPMLCSRPGHEDEMFFVGATYADELVRTPSGWRIARRTETNPWAKDVPADLTPAPYEG